MIKKILANAFFSFLLLTGAVKAQIISEGLKQFLHEDARIKTLSLKFSNEVKEVYRILKYQPGWIGYPARIQNLLQLLEKSGSLGLEEEDYQYSFIHALKNNNPGLLINGDSIATELLFTDAAIHFFNDLVYGNNAPELGYNGLNYKPACVNIPELLATAILNDNISMLFEILELKTPEYIFLKQKIERFNAISTENTFKEIVIRSSRVSDTNKELLQKLYQLGVLDSISEKITDASLKEKIKSAQRLFNLLPDGILRSTALQEFNVPLQTRLKELKKAINTIRWLYCIKRSSKGIVVNIPSATLIVYDEGIPVLESKIIVGKKSTPTPTLCSKVTEVILYPYWMVPYSIATKELLPSIKRNIGFLDAGNYQVIDKSGRVVDPYKINWNTLSAANFPYIIRQSTGCDNALGLIKLNFYNPFSVYLHDTPNKSLFNLNKRYFSHGCMRVEKAMELGRIVLKSNVIAIDTLEEKGCLYNQSPITVPADEIVPVFVLYNTAWVDSTGKVTFNEDVYGRLKPAFKK